MRLIVMFLLIFAPTSRALAQGNWTGKEFLDACKVLATSVDAKNDSVDDPVLVGYCAGTVHTLMIPRKYSDFKICPPEVTDTEPGGTLNAPRYISEEELPFPDPCITYLFRLA